MDHLFIVDLDRSAMVEAYLLREHAQPMMKWGALRHRAHVPVSANVERPTTALLAWEFGASGPSGSPDVSAGGSRSFLTTGQRRAVTAPVEQAQGDEVVGGPEPVGHAREQPQLRVRRLHQCVGQPVIVSRDLGSNR